MQLAEGIRAEIPGITVETRTLARVPGLEAGANRDTVDELKRFLRPPDPVTTTVPFVSEGGLFQEAGIPAVVCGPGLLEQAHQPNERVSIKAMSECGDFLMQVISHNTL